MWPTVKPNLHETYVEIVVWGVQVSWGFGCAIVGSGLYEYLPFQSTHEKNIGGLQQFYYY
jgi:hypothetical protein